jgi:lipopolysaccharide transport system ATP-binding protein
MKKDDSCFMLHDAKNSDDIAISVKHLSKKYHLYDSPKDRLKEALHPFRKKCHHDFWALRDISFEVKKGECLGIIGRNGSGKSTLLQILCGVLQKTTGEIVVNGEISALLELGSGFNPEYSGRQNVYINGALMGFSVDEMDHRFPAIADFAGIGEFMEQPVKTYSSGMYVRLGFACMISLQPDVLIVDEALSVGDIFFQQKCFAAIREKISNGTTCLFVSHDTKAVMNICDGGILLKNGEIEFQGSPEETVSRYFSKLGGRTLLSVEDSQCLGITERDASISAKEILNTNILPGNVTRHGAGGLRILAVRIVDDMGSNTLQVAMLGSLNFHILLKAEENIVDPSSGIHIYDRLGNLVFASGTRQLKHRLPDLRTGQHLFVNIRITFSVQPGDYTFSLGASEASLEGGGIGFLHDRCESLGPIAVVGFDEAILPFYGVAQLPMSVNHARVAIG